MAPEYIDGGIIKTPVSGMFHLCDVFQFIIYGFNDSPLPKQQSVRHAHQSPLHVALSLVTSCMPSTNSRWNRFLPMYPLSANILP